MPESNLVAIAVVVDDVYTVDVVAAGAAADYAAGVETAGGRRLKM
jgi:hypothetical protein